MISRTFQFLLFLTLGFLLLSACSNPQENSKAVSPLDPFTYPTSRQSDHFDVYHGDTVADPYHWLEVDSSAEVKKWVEAQNQVTFSYLQKLPVRDTLLNEMLTHANYTRYGLPFRRGKFLFYTRNDGLQNQSIWYRSLLDGTQETVLVDPNLLSADGSISISFFSVNKAGNRLAYGLSTAGSDWNTIRMIDLDRMEHFPETLEWVKFSGANWWKNGFVYKKYPQPSDGAKLSAKNESPQLYYHVPGQPQSDDVLVYERSDDPKISFSMAFSEDEQYAYLYHSKGASRNNDFWLAKADKIPFRFQPIVDDFNASISVLNLSKGQLYILTNREAPRYQVITTSVSNPSVSRWRTFIPEKAEVLESATMFIDGLWVVKYLKDVQNHSYLLSPKAQIIDSFPMPGPGTLVGPSGNEEDSIAYISFSSFTNPGTIYTWNIKNRMVSPWKQVKWPFDTSRYATEQIFFKSTDGNQVPMFITYRVDMKNQWPAPAWVYGYGGFNISIKPSFSVSRLPFLDRGGVYVSVNLRGGSEYGELWHQQGMLLNKQQVFDDMHAAVEYLRSSGIADSSKVAISGRSNGGLLVGAVMTQRPDLYTVALPAVGVLDMLKFHQFTIGYAWVPEYGSSDDSIQYAYLKKYSPLHRLQEGVRYPATLITTADHDDRVVPAHSYKFAARLQACHSGESPVLIRIDTKAGHGSGKPLRQELEENADIQAFMMRHLGMTLP